jgi:hypothetical protein
MKLRPFSDLLCSPYEFYIILDSSTSVFCSRCSRHLVAKRGESGREIAAEFCLSVSLSYLKWYLTCHKNLRHGADGFIHIYLLLRSWMCGVLPPLLHMSTNCSSPSWYMSKESHGRILTREYWISQSKTCPSATLSTTDSTRTQADTYNVVKAKKG